MCLVNLQCLCCVISLFCVPDGADQPQGKLLCVEELPVFVFPVAILWRFMAAELLSSVSYFLSCRCLPLNKQWCELSGAVNDAKGGVVS